MTHLRSVAPAQLLGSPRPRLRVLLVSSVALAVCVACLLPAARLARAEGGAEDDPTRRDVPALVARVAAAVLPLRIGGLPQGKDLRSAIALRSDGFLLTLLDDTAAASALQVRLPDGSWAVARSLGRDPASGVALLRVAARDLPTLPMAPKQSLRPGDETLLLAARLEGPASVHRVGVAALDGASATGAGGPQWLWLDGRYPARAQGGALLDAEGRVVALLAPPATQRDELHAAAHVAGLGRIIGPWLVAGGAQRPQIGLRVSELDPPLARSLGLEAARGALVQAVMAGGPGALAGVEPGDLIVGVDHEPLSSAEELKARLLGYVPGQKVRLELLHRGTETTLWLTLGGPVAPPAQPGAGPSAPAETPPPPSLGLRVQALEAGESAPGVASPGLGLRVTEVEPGGAAQTAGIAVGDILVRAGDAELRSVGDLRSALGPATGDRLNLLVHRGERRLFFSLDLSVPAVAPPATPAPAPAPAAAP